MECKLKELLRSGDITRISNQTGIHRNTITRYKENKRLPRIDHAYKIADFFNKSVYDIWPPN